MRPEDDQPDEGFAGRWARRKRAARDGEERPPPEPVEVAPDTSPEAEAQRAANRAAAEAVDLETIDRDTDMSVFGRDGVPDWLRRKAFRVLWRSNPVFANVDGLNDYDEDFARPDLVMKTFRSAYEAGRGYLAHIEAQAAKERSGEAGADAPDVTEAEPTEPAAIAEDEVVADERPEAVAAVDVPLEEAQPSDDAPPPGVSLRRRLMLGG